MHQKLLIIVLIVCVDYISSNEYYYDTEETTGNEIVEQQQVRKRLQQLHQRQVKTQETTTFGDGQFLHRGRYTHDLLSGELITPQKVNHVGEHLSHNLTHFHDYDDDHRVYYHIPIGNETLHLELSPSKTFIAPQMIVERHRRDLRTRRKPKQHNCHYEGKIRGHDDSRVALSACNGLTGFMRGNTGDYLIEPSKNHVANGENGHPHIVFQKSNVKSNRGNGHHGEPKRHKKKRRRRKRHVNNCSTKEPKRMTETRIEWQNQGKVTVQGSRRARGHRKNRIKRSISRPRHVEALLVADQSMVTFHQDDDVEIYLLSIMNMVSSLYKDPSIGNQVHVVVVKIILLEDDESELDLNVTHNAEVNLQNFCKWQRQHNPKLDADPHHHDVGILITRKDICSKQGCLTLGIANVGGMCRPDRSCSVNEDNGITLAHTIAHELGHNFGMYHDTDKIGCERRSGSILHVMTPSFEADTMQVMWSNCSRRDITLFLDQGLGKCLDDQPIQQAEFMYPELPPGAMYNADLQCRLQFNSTDESIKVCSQLHEICSQLWCLVDGNCNTLLRPAAPGTHCGKHQWCQDKECVPIDEQPKAVDGGWGNWSDYSNCSRICGAGVSVQTRLCDNPPPAHGGSFCIGERTRYKVCNIDECPGVKVDFRAEQCTKFNNETFREKKYTWLPFFDVLEPCELYCTDTDDTIIVPWGESVIDGTPCNLGTNDMCISGICRRVGCDWAVDSNTTEDDCGICGGDGSTCITIKGEFNKKLPHIDGYYEITTIPSGSRNILVEETVVSKNFISISRTNSTHFYLNGNRLISMSGQIEIAGSKGLYSREEDLDKLKIPGPILEEISVHVLFRSKQKNCSIKYEYTLSSNSSALPIFHWKLGDWAACSRTCGGGLQRRIPICSQHNRGLVDEENCWSNAEGERPEEKTRVCNEDPCHAHWWEGPWQLCPVTCRTKKYPDPVKQRAVMCIDQNTQALPDSKCADETRPIDTEPCGPNVPFCDSGDEDEIEEMDNNTF